MQPPRCPTCKRPLPEPAGPSAPFCGSRCKLVDLSNWFDERYVVRSPLPFDEQDPRVPERDDILHGGDE